MMAREIKAKKPIIINRGLKLSPRVVFNKKIALISAKKTFEKMEIPIIKCENCNKWVHINNYPHNCKNKNNVIKCKTCAFKTKEYATIKEALQEIIKHRCKKPTRGRK